MAVSAAHWARIEELLPQALELPAQSREDFLRKHCRGDAALLAELRALLSASEDSHDLLKPIALDAAGAPAEEALPPGTLLGAWRVGPSIGHGGMGQVYAAERADGQFEMAAALKVLKRGLDTDALLQRFRRERQILARLSHPNIARLLDAGATADGRPWFVMERVDGEPITAHCARVGADIPTILRLVSQACLAVSAAHREHIVHRDLKPSNLLVAASGEVKLLDFGIAKALGSDGAQQTLMEARLLTPSYAAPEQILGGPVSTATDVYALGVVLFELLTGQLPHRRDGVPLPVLTAELRNEVTTRPSRVLQRATANLPAESGRRARELAGDLDHIVLKAMHAEPQRRYASAFELAEDLHRYLDHHPVRARPDSAAYRARRFVQRHPVPVAAASVAVTALVTGLAIALWQAGVARAEARRAEHNLATARAVSAFVTEDLLASVDPDKRSTANITLKEMLETAAAQVDRRFADRPEVAAELHHALGQSYGGLGLHEEKRAQAASAVALFEQVHGADAESTLRARHELGLALKQVGDLAGALAAQETTYAGWQRRGQAGHADALLARLQVAALKESLGGDLLAALAEIRAVTAALERAGAPEDDVRLAQSSLADHLEGAAEYAEAEALYRRLLDSLEARPANRYLMRPKLMGSYAHTLIVLGRHAEAERTLARLRADLEKLVPPTHAQFRLLHMYEALLGADQGRLRETATALQPLFAAGSDLWTMVASAILADAEVRAGRHAQAAARARTVIAMQREAFPPDDPSFVQVATILVDALRLSGRLPDAAQALDVAGPALGNLPPRHPMLAHYRRAQGLLWLAQGRGAEARAALAEAHSIYVARLGAGHWRTRRAQEELALAKAPETP